MASLHIVKNAERPFLSAEGASPAETSYEKIERLSTEAKSRRLKYSIGYYSAEYQEASKRIRQARASSMDCEEDEECISFLTEQRAKNLMLAVVERTEEENLQFYLPSVAATPQGNISLSWNHEGRWVVVTVVPPHEAHICVTRTPQGESNREARSDRGAVSCVLSYFRTRQESHA